MKAVCMACGEEFIAVDGHLCEPSAMKPLTRQIDNLLKNNELLGEILTTLRLLRKHDLTPEILPDLVQRWNKQKRKIKED